MTRDECEKQIEKKLREIEKIVQRYNPGNTYLEMCIINGTGYFFNEYWDSDKPIRANGFHIGERRNDDEFA